MSNRHVLLVSGKSASGKSMSLHNLPDPNGVIYLCCESGKDLPFKSKFREQVIIDPININDIIVRANDAANIHTIVIDSLDYMMDMYESLYVTDSQDTRKAWGAYGNFFRKLMHHYVASSTKNIIFMAHTTDIYNESDLVTETMVRVKGNLMNQGIESYFGNVVSTKKIPTRVLKKFNNPMLNITPDEDSLGFKYVYQTQLTKETYNERIRGPIGLWTRDETYIDNDVSHVLKRLHKYYG